MQQQGTECEFKDSNSWVILSPIELSIKRKIESVGTPLKDWDINIYRGVLTGCNEAFIISTEKRNEILSNCKDDDERIRTEALIRPILRGRDIKRYSYNWAGLWLINTHNGVKGRIPRIDINDYPAVKEHLDKYWDMISSRADKGDTPYNLRNCAYLEDFSQPKIIYQELSQGSSFAIDKNGEYVVSNTGYILTGQNLDYLLIMLNSAIVKYAYRTFYATMLGSSGVRWLAQHIIHLPIPIYKGSKLQNDLISNKKEQLVADIYGLTSDEMSFVDFQ